jgi:aquaporin Z
MAAEGVGTFFATLVPTTIDVLYYQGESGVDYVSRWLARGCITIAMIYTFSEVSGAHIDPAVSFGFFLRRVMPIRLLGCYWIAQFAGAFAAAGTLYAFWGNAIALGASHPGPAISDPIAFATEIVLTFLLMLVILAMAQQEATVGKQAAIAVGLTVATCGFFAGPISGASMNPARSIAPQLVGGAGSLSWIYLLAPCIGAALAAAAAWMFFGAPAHGERKAAEGQP